jgi:hypothetical protein
LIGFVVPPSPEQTTAQGDSGDGGLNRIAACPGQSDGAVQDGFRLIEPREIGRGHAGEDRGFNPQGRAAIGVRDMSARLGEGRRGVARPPLHSSPRTSDKPPAPRGPNLAPRQAADGLSRRPAAGLVPPSFEQNRRRIHAAAEAR